MTKQTQPKTQTPRTSDTNFEELSGQDASIAYAYNACSHQIATFLQLLKETGARCGEAFNLKWTDIDFATTTVRITLEKGSNPRIFKMSGKLACSILCKRKAYKYSPTKTRFTSEKLSRLSVKE